jgi:hypothetical protein
MTSSFARKSGRFPHPFRQFVSGLVAIAMATVGLVGIQVVASQPASAAGNAPVGYVVNQTAGTVTVVNLQSNATVVEVPKDGLAWWAWALIGLGIVAAFSFILVMVVRYERRRAASHRA